MNDGLKVFGIRTLLDSVSIPLSDAVFLGA